MKSTVIFLMILCALFAGCHPQVAKRTLTQPENIQTVDGKLPYLKAHLHNGDVYVFLKNWVVNPGQKTVSGQSLKLNAQREFVQKSRISLAIDSVAIFETNQMHPAPAIGGLSLISGISAIMTGMCAANPKACFGSCPTFYASDSTSSKLQAEGFSASITPALEASDIDALYHAHPDSRQFEITMKNEAIETHVVRHVDVLSVPRLKGNRVFSTPNGTFYQTRQIIVPDHCFAPEGDCVEQITAFDGMERFSPTDSTDVAAKETLDIPFKTVPNGPLGLVIAARQTLLSTYIFYQGLSYLGTSAGAWMASLERGDPVAWQGFHNLGNMLGGIEVQIKNPDGQWATVGEVTEAGPLATDIRVVPLLGLQTDSLTVRLRLTKGHYRIDHIALATLGDEVHPIRLHPKQVRHFGQNDPVAKQALLDSTQTLIAMPGDVYTLMYELPRDFENHELFLESRGYYIEWMRQEWLAEENALYAAHMLLAPDLALRLMAPKFKKVESQMEPIFWSSRYAH